MSGLQASIAEIAAATRGRLRGDVDASVVVAAVATDTRRLPPPPFVFVALSGPNFDGNAFAAEALAEGAALVVVSSDAALDDHAPRLLVDDGLEALQMLAAWWRGRFGGQVVGITGSHGKTVVKEMLASALAPHRRVYRSPGSYNSQVGVALSLLSLPLDAEVALIECGVSRTGEMERLRAMVDPDLGVLTHIGAAHLAGFGSLDRIASEKLRLFTEMAGDLVLHETALAYRGGVPPGARQLWVGESVGGSVGAGDEASVRLVEQQPTAEGYRARIRFVEGASQGAPIELRLSSYAEHDVHNAACAAAAAWRLGLEPEAVVEGLEQWRPVPLRIEVHTSPSYVTLINDSYSADPTSMRSALRTLERLAAGRRSVAVLGAMRDLGAESEPRHREVGELAAQVGVGLLITVGERARPLAEAARSAGLPADRIELVDDAEACARLLDEQLRPGDVVLVKASRPLRLERTAEHLLESVSPTRLYLDLGVVAENVRRVRSWTGADVALMAVVKSFGYGSDVVRVSQLLEQQGVDYLFVAYPDEGTGLRRRGIRVPILVNNVLADEADKIAKYQLSAVAYSTDGVDALTEAAERHGVVIPVHLKVDTGMGRYGLAATDFLGLARSIDDASGLVLEGLMSHLAVADDGEQDDFTKAQIARFAEVVEELEAAGLRPRYRHLANSAGLLRFPAAHFNAVRLGLGLYGCLDAPPGPPGAPELAPALALHSRLVGIRDLEAGRSVGYGRTYTTSRPTRLGLVGLGYNDGLPWSASNRAELSVRGRRVPIIGSVCMDVTMIDLTEVSEARVGDDVVVFGDGEQGEPTVPELARWAGTIPYEILVRISPRVRRIVRLPS